MRARKFKKPRSPHKVFLVICEGETEETYIDALKHFYRLPITIKTKVSGNAINRRLVEKYVQELGVGSKEEYNIFYVYDADVESVVAKLHTLPDGILILSNPCIELWYLLHVKTQTRCRNSKEILNDLISCHNSWKRYSKGFLTIDQRKVLLENYGCAMARSKKMSWPDNPSTNMHLFLEALEKEKLLK